MIHTKNYQKFQTSTTPAENYGKSIYHTDMKCTGGKDKIPPLYLQQIHLTQYQSVHNSKEYWLHYVDWSYHTPQQYKPQHRSSTNR